MGNSLLSIAEAILGSPFLWGVAALVAVAITLSGKLDVTVANWLLTAAWILSAFSVYRSSPILHQYIVPRLLWVMCLSGAVGLGLYKLSLWMEPKPQVLVARSSLSGDVVSKREIERLDLGVSVEKQRRQAVRNEIDSFTDSERAALRFIAVTPATEAIIQKHVESKGLPWNTAMRGRLEDMLATRDYTTGKLSVMREYESVVHDILFQSNAPQVIVSGPSSVSTMPPPLIPVPASEHPIISASLTTVTRNQTTGDTTILIRLHNAGAVETMAHITFVVLWNGLPLPQNNPERDLAFAPGAKLDVSYEWRLAPELDVAFVGGSRLLSARISAEYPDRGNKTVYVFEGWAELATKQLNVTENNWKSLK